MSKHLACVLALSVVACGEQSGAAPTVEGYLSSDENQTLGHWGVGNGVVGEDETALNMGDTVRTYVLDRPF